MSFIHALAEQYESLLEQGYDIPRYGYSREAVSFEIVLTHDGAVVDVMDRRDTTGKKPLPARIVVPSPAPDRRGLKVVPNFLWDKTAYALGVTQSTDGEPVPSRRGEHDAFRKAHEDALAHATDPGLRAMGAFVRVWNPQRYEELQHARQGMLDQNVVFSLDGAAGLIHECEEANAIWQTHLEDASQASRLCLVSGRRAPVERLHAKIKGVRGAQSAGAVIVAFNQDAFTSYDLDKGDNAAVSQRSAFAYVTALNAMLAPNSGRNLDVAGTTLVFWADASGNKASAMAAETLYASLLNPPPPTDDQESAAVAATLEGVAEGRPLAHVAPNVQEKTIFYVLGISPNASRLAIRFWHEDTIGAFARRIGEHWRDLRMEPSAWKAPPSVWRLLIETAAQRKSKNIPPTLGGALMRSILTGGRYPHALFAAVLARMRADNDINGMRVAICKACLARDYRLSFEDEDVPMSLNRDENNAAYRLGRLFAMYEKAQRAALGQSLNATIKDRFFGAASATPASIFPLLARSSTHHLAVVRKRGDGKLAGWFEKEIDAIVGGIESSFPRSLRLEEQGRFAIGYHHQRNAGRTDADSSGDDADTATHDEE